MGRTISGLNRTFTQIGWSGPRWRNGPDPPGSQEVRGSNPLTSTEAVQVIGLSLDSRDTGAGELTANARRCDRALRRPDHFR
jgi:hypothetical protein